MSENELENYLLGQLHQLEKSAEQIVKTQGYTSEVEKIKMLSELIKEQLKNENINSSASAIR